MIDNKLDRNRTITFQELGEIQSAERGSTALTRLPDQFYEKATTYLKSLLAEMENCTSENTKDLDERYYRVSEEYRRSKDILERVYSTRERKIVLAALNSSRGINQKTDEMIHDEEELYFSLKVELEDIRERALRYDRFHRKPSMIRPETGINTTTDDFLGMGGDMRSIEEGPTKAPMRDKALADLEELGSEVRNDEKSKVLQPKEDDVMVQHGPNTGPGPVKRKMQTENIDNDVIVVRAIKDIEPFVGPDNRTISMKKEDVASLPSQVASILIQGGMAQPVEEG